MLSFTVLGSLLSTERHSCSSRVKWWNLRTFLSSRWSGGPEPELSTDSPPTPASCISGASHNCHVPGHQCMGSSVRSESRESIVNSLQLPSTPPSRTDLAHFQTTRATTAKFYLTAHLLITSLKCFGCCGSRARSGSWRRAWRCGRGGSRWPRCLTSPTPTRASVPTTWIPTCGSMPWARARENASLTR